MSRIFASPNQRSRTNYFYYFGLLIAFGVGLWLILITGSRFNPPRPTDQRATVASSAVESGSNGSLSNLLRLEDRSALSILLLQIIVIIVVAKIFGAIFRRIGQPPVMGEMVAGIALGPSLLGAVLPQATALLFPPASMATLGLLSQIGVVLFMFIVGMELDLQHLRERASSAIMVSHASIIIPFLLGAGLALSLFPTLAPPGGDIHAFCAVHRHRDEYYSVSRSSSHPPDRQLSQSPLGTTALACAAVGDVSAWCILAVAIAAVNSTGLSAALLTVLITLILVAVVGKLGGKHADGALDAYDLARFVCDRCFNEHSRRTLAD